MPFTIPLGQAIRLAFQPRPAAGLTVTGVEWYASTHLQVTPAPDRRSALVAGKAPGRAVLRVKATLADGTRAKSVVTEEAVTVADWEGVLFELAGAPAGPATPSPPAPASPPAAPPAVRMPASLPLWRPPAWARSLWLTFDGPAVPANGDGPYVSPYHEPTAGGIFTAALTAADAVVGSSLECRMTAGAFYAQLNPFNYRGTPGFPPARRGFAREYVADPAGWRLNTYNRLRLWVKLPAAFAPHATDGQNNFVVGQYVKRVADADPFSDETGGGHPYNGVNVPATGTWVQVLLNMHPDHWRGATGGQEHGYNPYPTGEAGYNYWDALTRVYLSSSPADPVANALPPGAVILLDELEFYQDPNHDRENNQQVYSLAGTYVAAANRLILTWDRHKDENAVPHEVRYAFTDIHQAGWDAAMPAPDGLVTPPGWQGYNNMVYDTARLPLAGKPAVYVAIKPQNSDRFSQIVVPLDVG